MLLQRMPQLKVRLPKRRKSSLLGRGTYPRLYISVAYLAGVGVLFGTTDILAGVSNKVYKLGLPDFLLICIYLKDSRCLIER